MEENTSEVPLLPDGKKVGIICNLKKGGVVSTADEEAEYDNPETVYAIRSALIGHGIEAVVCEADTSLPETLKKQNIGFAFNIAEGKCGRGREAQIPALLNMYSIPFTGSDETTLCVALDKALTKRVLSTYGIKTPKYAVVYGKMPRVKLKYPVIVKPNAEGSGKGISDVSIVGSDAELKALCEKNIALYGGEMLAEEFISGREFTVGVLGNGKNTRVFRPMEIVFDRSRTGDFNVYSYKVKQNYKEYVEYECPSSLDKKTEDKMMKIAAKVYASLGCRDMSRMDFRLSEDGEIFFIEINPLPGLAPGYSDFPMLCEFCGMDYDTLIYEIFLAAAKRYGFVGEARR